MNNQNALIFGATGGIGSAICRELSSQGYNCHLMGRSIEKLGQLRKQLQLPTKNTLCLPAITSPDGFEQVKDWLNSLNLQFSIAVHSAGFGLLKSSSDVELAEWQSLMDINLNSAFAFYKLAWEFRATGSLELVYFGSASTDQAWPKNTLYGASKAGLEMFARSLQKEIRPKGGRVWLYRPGSVRTGFFDQLPNHLPREKMIDPETLARLVVGNFSLDQSIYMPEIVIYSE